MRGNMLITHIKQLKKVIYQHIGGGQICKIHVIISMNRLVLR